MSPEWKENEGDSQEIRKMNIEEEKYEWDIKELIKFNFVNFAFFRQGNFFYNIRDNKSRDLLQFPVPLDDIGTATMLEKDKAITYMRWIRKAIQDKTLIKI